jgi:hypothetical protein
LIDDALHHVEATCANQSATNQRLYAPHVARSSGPTPTNRSSPGDGSIE